jgi:hypothetical protein
MIRYSRFVEPEVSDQRAAPKTTKPRTVILPSLQAAAVLAPTALKPDVPQLADDALLPGVEGLELTARDNRPPKIKKGKSVMRKPKTPPADSGTAPALPLLAQFEI